MCIYLAGRLVEWFNRFNEYDSNSNNQVSFAVRAKLSIVLIMTNNTDRVKGSGLVEVYKIGISSSVVDSGFVVYSQV